MGKIPVGVIGATGTVGQNLLVLLENHPWFEVVSVAASANSAGKTYAEAVAGKWKMGQEIPARIAGLIVENANDVQAIANEVFFIFSAISLSPEETRALEENYAGAETPVISCNSAHRWTPDVPMIIPEVNSDHLDIIPTQRRRLRTTRGFITVKPNCSLQAYVPALHPLKNLLLRRAFISTYQAVSGAGKTLADWPEMNDNIIPFIGGEEEKSENEPLKIWGRIFRGEITNTQRPIISAQCVRVPVSNGHLATVSVLFKTKPSAEDILERWQTFVGEPQRLNLPSAPTPFLTYFSEPNRPQTKLDRDLGDGMGIAIGRLREDPIFHYKFVCLSHNTIRGAGGGAILLAELAKAKGYL